MVADMRTSWQCFFRGISPLKQMGRLCLNGLLLCGFLVGLSGCGTTTNLASNFGLKTSEDSKNAAIARPVKSVAFVPLVGVPANVSGPMLTAMKSSVRAKNIPVTEEIATAGYLVRGYLVASPANSGGKLSYIWDINDNKGVRIHRVLGNEVISGGKTTNGWSLVDQKVIAKVASASSDKLAGFFAQAKTNAPEQAPLKQQDSPQTISPIAKRQNGTPSDPIITGAVNKSNIALLTEVQPVQGAPGDGRISLTNALRGELKRNGIALASGKVNGSYKVKGSVKLNNISGSSQKVNIVWNVYDATGNRVGTVSQNNIIPVGSLDGAWGPTAVAAASAAAKGIVKLLPSKKR